MSDHDFISLGVPLGTSRLTISATSVAALNGFINDLTEDDPIEGVAAVDTVLDGINTINAAVALKMPQFAPTEQNNSRPASPDGGFTPGMPEQSNAPKTCIHGVMTYREGTTKSGPNAGKPYKAFFCGAPRGANQCKPEFINN